MTPWGVFFSRAPPFVNLLISHVHLVMRMPPSFVEQPVSYLFYKGPTTLIETQGMNS